ncbi:MAG: site-2 protease family protein [Gemmataceae bacterium]|nr:site-2 protease family protein [Gemmataceae bacterium]
MRDPMTWSVPVFRAFGIPVRVHLFFFIVTLGLFLRVVLQKGNPVWWGDVFLFTIVLLFVVILLHEFGHQFGARWVDGEAKEILIWPLGGLAFNDIPHGWRPLFITVAAGPAVNVLICVACAAGLVAGGYLPNANPLSDPYLSRMYGLKEGRDVTGEYGLRLYRPGTAEPVRTSRDDYADWLRGVGRSDAIAEVFPPAENAEVARQAAQKEAAAGGAERGLAPGWAVWLNRTFWLSWVLFLFNLLPAYPLDGGQLLQALVWARTDYRRGVTVACYSGFAVAVLFLVVSIAFNEALFMGLAIFMLIQSTTRLFTLEAEDGPFGYDFSQGYTSLEKDDEPAPRPRRPGPIGRWLQARRERKRAREVEQRQRDEDRKEYLLEKIAASGMGSLTDEERRFLQQFSSRYKNRS